MKFLFLVGTAIKQFLEHEFGAFSEEERFKQTLKTIETIREKVPNSYIVVFECSYKEIEKQHKKILKDKCDLFLEFYEDPVLNSLYKNIEKKPNYLIFGKSLLETRGLLNTLNYIKDRNMFSDSKRIFKMSGRYTLNEDFNIDDYKSSFLDEKYVVKKYDYQEDDQENPYLELYQLKGMIVTGLWSFDKSLLKQTIKNLEKSFSYMEKMIMYTGGVDIEHSLYKFLNHKNILSISNLGLNVLKGFDGDSYKL